ncbi:hypothetical protein GGX14DRAFT_595797 [Mycena pura]|uniref:Uncharacterized protein n=1 Tax=Mycena pura TaxID=153505 RepID=A0AAD6UUK9_9AGAR|nr:hypothetical protein GGX14DRAFT_595797 [Mycena pura]
MHFFSVAASLAISTALAARGSPSRSLLQARTVAVHILTPPTDGTTPAAGTIDAEVCSSAQVTAIKNGITDARNMATFAIQVLGVENMQKSNGFFWLFGGDGSTATPDGVAERFKFVLNLNDPDLITSTKPYENSATDLIFTCIPGTAKLYANTVNVNRPTTSNTAPTLNLIRLSSLGLANTESYVDAAQRITTSGDISQAFPVSNGVPQPPIAFTLVHEVQHADPLLDNPQVNHFADQLGADGKRAYGIKQVQQMSPNLKKLNPQNYAFFALLAQSNSEFFDPQKCYVGEQLGSRAPLQCSDIVNGFPGDFTLDYFADGNDA